MLISRRSTLATAAVAAAAASAPASAGVRGFTAASGGAAQRVESLLIHQDESGEQFHCAALTLKDTGKGWATIGAVDETRLGDALTAYRASGYGLVRLSAFRTRDGARYTAVWQAGRAAPAQVQYDMTEATFTRAAQAFAARGLMLAHADASATADGARFAAIWEPTDGTRQTVATGLTTAQYKARATALAADGFRVRQVAGYAPGGSARFAAVFVKDGVQAEARHAIPAAKFAALSRTMLASGFNLKDASGYVAGGRPFYTAVWEKA